MTCLLCVLNSTRCWVSWIYQQNLNLRFFVTLLLFFQRLEGELQKTLAEFQGKVGIVFFWKIRHSLTWSCILFSPRFSAWKIMHWINTCSKQVKAPWTCWGLWAIIYSLRTRRKLLQFSIKRLKQSILSFKVDMPTFNIGFFWERKRLPI